MNPIPSVPKDLVEFLDKLFPARSPRINDAERQIWIDAGKRELVEQLKQWRKDQEQGADEGFPHVFVHTPVDAGGPDDQQLDGPSTDPRTGSSAAGSYASPADRLRHFG